MRLITIGTLSSRYSYEAINSMVNYCFSSICKGIIQKGFANNFSLEKIGVPTLALIHNKLKIYRKVRDTILMKSWKVLIDPMCARKNIQVRKNGFLEFLVQTVSITIKIVQGNRKSCNYLRKLSLLVPLEHVSVNEGRAVHFRLDNRYIFFILWVRWCPWNSH